MHLWLSCTFFSKRRILFRIDFQSSTFGYEKKSILNKILHSWLRKLEKPPLWEFFFFLLDFLSKLEKPPLLVVFFSKVRISFRIDFQSSTFGVFFFSKKDYFGTKSSTFGVFFSQNHPLLVTKTWKTSTFFFLRIFLQNLKNLHFWLRKLEKLPLLVFFLSQNGFFFKTSTSNLT